MVLIEAIVHSLEAYESVRQEEDQIYLNIYLLKKK